MSKFRKVYSTFWDDQFNESLSPEDRYFYLFLLTNPLVNECGVYHITKKKMSYYTGYNVEAIENLVKRFITYDKIHFDVETSELILLNHLVRTDKFGKPMIDCITSEFKKVINKKLITVALEHTTDLELKELRQQYL